MIRLATKPDKTKVFKWRNKPSVYELGEQSRPVSWKEHSQFFNKCISGISNRIFIIEPDMGTVRLDRNGNIAIISIYLLEQFRGQGHALPAIIEATKEAFLMWDIDRVIANVGFNNLRSKAVFEKAGYEPADYKDGYFEYEFRK